MHGSQTTTRNRFRERLPWPAQPEPLKLTQDGDGKPWITLSSIAAIPLKAPLSSGYKVTKSVAPVQQKTPGQWSRGDVARVHLEVEAQADMTWVVVDDPIPAGSTALGSGLGGDSTLARAGEKARRHGLARVRGTHLRRVPRVLPLRAERALHRRILGASQQSRRIQSAADARRGDVRTGDVR